MKLKSILKNISYREIKGSKEVNITSVTADSKAVFPGSLFIARKGKKFDAADFISEAVKAGAAAIVSDFYDPFLQVTQIICDDVAKVEADIAAGYYNFPARDLFMVGITGTNGKTTSAYLVKHLLDGLGKQCGLIGTIEYIIGTKILSASRTTPDSVTNQRLLKDMLLNGCLSSVMEVTSHALDQERVKNIPFAVAIFTNITQDHFDYHQTFENYFLAKKRLFDLLKGKAIINVDDPSGLSIVKDSAAEVITYGIEKEADLVAKEIFFSPEGSRFIISYKGEEESFFSPLIGRFNIYNILAAVGALIHLSSLKELSGLVKSFKSVRGRLERVETNRGFYLFVDFAHTEAALQNVLKTLKEITRGRLITLFGCGGDRDRLKRPKMASVVESYADIAIVTSDNPRSEAPEDIIREIIAGFTNRSCYMVEADRRLAIEKALSIAKADDVILIAGKGHETQQIFSDHTVDFDDVKVAKDILSRGV